MNTSESPTLECDLILKGGITSGIVYPGVATELASKYRFRNIGGTSAGAIAAAAIAAAEHGRQTGQDGFPALADLPHWLGTKHEGDSNLKNLFKPNIKTERLHTVLTAGLGQENAFSKLLSKLLRVFVQPFLIGSVPGLLVCLLFLWSTQGLVSLVGLISGLVVAIVGGIGLLAYRFFTSSSGALESNYLGLTTGHDPCGSSEKPMLTDWLAGYLDELAGIKDSEKPLTFRDLKDVCINLHMITTCVTHGRPYNLPFDTKIFYMNRKDLRAFYPQKIVTWLEKVAEETDDLFSDEQYIQLPSEDDLPVAFATRLSLSFPLLISAVPLYARDVTRRHEEDRNTFERCWFTDGGVSSNFPVHLFDSALPSRPTFAINLKPHHIDYGEDSWDFQDHQGVWMASINSSGLNNWWTRFNDDKGFLSLASFIKAMVEAGFNWQDTLLAGAPGQRDRIVQVGLGKGEGGLNLDMDARTITALYERGQVAGKKLIERFYEGNHELNWDNHKWIRYRSFMAALELTLEEFHDAFLKEADLGMSYQELLDRPIKDGTTGYTFKTFSNKQLAKSVTKDMLDLIKGWKEDDKSLGEGAPSPVGRLRRGVD